MVSACACVFLELSCLSVGLSPTRINHCVANTVLTTLHQPRRRRRALLSCGDPVVLCA